MKTWALATRRTAWVPTWLGWLLLACIAAAPACWWWFSAESFFAVTDRAPTANVLVVEGWIGIQPIHAAAEEFRRSGAQYIVAAGGPTDDTWADRRWSFSDMARLELLHAGIPDDRIIVARVADSQSQRTYGMAVAAAAALRARGIRPAGVNVYTIGAHARRSRLVFERVFAPCSVGVIAWWPDHETEEPWWHSSKRAEDLLKETVGYLYERLLSSGRQHAD